MISDDIHNDLNQAYMVEEVRKSIFQIRSVSPSLDGLPACFYQHYWDIIGNKDNVINLNQIFIFFIPKIFKPISTLDYRLSSFKMSFLRLSQKP